MPLTPARRVLLGVGVSVMVVLTTAGNDPPVDVAGGSIYGTTQILHHVWHKVEPDGGSYSVVKTPDNTHIVIQDGNGNTLDCTASEWMVSLYKTDDTDPTAQLCTNNQCDMKYPNDPDENIYLTSYPRTPPASRSRGRKRWKHSGLGIAWWKIEFEDKVAITKIELVTVVPPPNQSPTGIPLCPSSWSKPVLFNNWHILVGLTK